VRRYANGGIEQFRPLAEELVRLKLDLIVALGTPATMAAKSATSTIPIVFAASDPVGQGLVATLGRPGGNVTGFSTAGPEIEAKRIEILREVLPTLTRVGVMENSNIPYYRSARKGIERACRSLGIEPIFVEVAAASDLTAAVAEVARRGGQALTAQSDFFDVEGELLRAALKHKLPTMVSPIYVRQVGALIAYDPNFAEIGQRTMAFVDRVLRGAKPANLPVEQPTKFDLIINLTTARALRLTIAKSLLLRADELIQ
jgi:putative ABC transport system substrate-binding protein